MGEVFKLDQDLKIKEKETVNGGKFYKVLINGEGTINGDVECKKFLVPGICKMMGNLKCKVIETKGRALFDKNVQAEKSKFGGIVAVKGKVDVDDLVFNGRIAVEGDVTGRDINILGMASITANLKAECLFVSGAAYIEKNIDTEIFSLSGGLVNKGTINANNINMTLGAKSNMNNISGKEIKIKKPDNTGGFLSSFLKKFIKNKVQLEANIIDGEDIHIENTIANLVRGNNVTIGEGCIINTVEYRNTINFEKNGKCKSQKKI